VNDNFTRQFVLNNSGLGCFLTILLVGLLLGSVGLGWIVNGFLILVAMLILIPVIAFWGLRWWLKQNLVEAQCPTCNYEFTGFRNIDCRCPSCEEALKVDGDRFVRLTPPDTIDVEAIEVSAKQLED
jgi:hypothetical protein